MNEQTTHIDPPTELVCLLPGQEPDFMMGNIPSTYRARAGWTGGAYTMMEQVIAPRLLVAPHTHLQDDHVSYLVSGTLGFRVGAKEVELEAGASIFRPRGVPHTLWNPTDEPAVMLEITSPGRLEDYIERLRELGSNGNADQDAVRELAAEFQIEFFEEWTADLASRHQVAPGSSFWRQ